ncbi:hypothetical protein LWI28_022589 [Acer negundo]|uniref:Reverse transcriptase domain-containing protein n=1 Tax=Acer negundo TaxID=4023 RepID=A0AAD5NK72_ACENE|nr:hypothetical protein LWI28_022589 [Acer negundo]
MNGHGKQDEPGVHGDQDEQGARNEQGVRGSPPGSSTRELDDDIRAIRESAQPMLRNQPSPIVLDAAARSYELRNPGVDGVFKDTDLEELTKWDWEGQDKEVEDNSEFDEEQDKNEEFENLEVSIVSLAKDPPPKLELKKLPITLKYVYLGEDETYPVIVASGLKNEEEMKLIKVLQKHKSVIG